MNGDGFDLGRVMYKSRQIPFGEKGWLLSKAHTLLAIPVPFFKPHSLIEEIILFGKVLKRGFSAGM